MGHGYGWVRLGGVSFGVWAAQDDDRTRCVCVYNSYGSESSWTLPVGGVQTVFTQQLTSTELNCLNSDLGRCSNVLNSGLRVVFIQYV